jgi:hypothetical protein
MMYENEEERIALYEKVRCELSTCSFPSPVRPSSDPPVRRKFGRMLKVVEGKLAPRRHSRHPGGFARPKPKVGPAVPASKVPVEKRVPRPSKLDLALDRYFSRSKPSADSHPPPPKASASVQRRARSSDKLDDLDQKALAWLKEQGFR